MTFKKDLGVSNDSPHETMDAYDTLFSCTRSDVHKAIARMPLAERAQHGRNIHNAFERNDQGALETYLKDNFGNTAHPDSFIEFEAGKKGRYKTDARRQTLCIFVDAYMHVEYGKRLPLLTCGFSVDELRRHIEELINIIEKYFKGYVPPPDLLCLLYEEQHGSRPFLLPAVERPKKDWPVIDLTVLDLPGVETVTNAVQMAWLQTVMKLRNPGLDLSATTRSRWKRIRGASISFNDIVPGGVLPDNWLRVHQDIGPEEAAKISKIIRAEADKRNSLDTAVSKIALRYGLVSGRDLRAFTQFGLLSSLYPSADSLVKARWKEASEIQENLRRLSAGEPTSINFHPSINTDKRLMVSFTPVERSIEKYCETNGFDDEFLDQLATLGRTQGCSVPDCFFDKHGLAKHGLDPGVWLPDVLQRSNVAGVEVTCPLHFYVSRYFTVVLGQDLVMSRALRRSPRNTMILLSFGCCLAPSCTTPEFPTERYADPHRLVPAVCRTCRSSRLRSVDRLLRAGQRARTKGSFHVLNISRDDTAVCKTSGCRRPAYTGIVPSHTRANGGLGFWSDEGAQCREHFEAAGGLGGSGARKEYGAFDLSNGRLDWRAVQGSVSRLTTLKPADEEAAVSHLVKEARPLSLRLTGRGAVSVWLAYLVLVKALYDKSTHAARAWQGILRSMLEPEDYSAEELKPEQLEPEDQDIDVAGDGSGEDSSSG